MLMANGQSFNIMTTKFTDHYFIFVALGKRSDANLLAKAWDFDTGGDKTFSSVRLSANGREPATHVACNTAADARMKAGIVASRSSTAQTKVYSKRDGWTWKKALRDMKLKVIESEII